MEREELHRRIELLQQMFKEGKIKIPHHLSNDFMKSINNVKILHDGMIDPDTVDGTVRSLCMLVAYEQDRQEWKDAISLQDIQEGYFQRVNYAFGQLFEMMEKAKVDPYKFASFFVSDKDRVKECLPVIDEFLDEIKQFWDNISEPTWIHLEDSDVSKAVFGGELFPDGTSNLASSTGLYFDTTILPDPFIKINPTLHLVDEKQKCYDIIRLALQVLSYKSLALNNTEKPIIAILPDRFSLDSGYEKFIFDCAITDSIAHTKALFGQEISDENELLSYYSQFRCAEDIVSKLINPQKLVFDTAWNDPLTDQINQFTREEGSKFGFKNPGQSVYIQLISRFSQANASYQRSQQLNGTPVVRAPTSWYWYNQMLEYNAGNSSTDSLNDLHVARALNSTVKNEIPWLGNIPPESLIEIRKSGALDEIRHLLSGGLEELIKADPSNFHKTSEHVFNNLDVAFKNHEKAIKELSDKKWKFAGKDITSFIVVGGISIAAALTSLPLFGVIGTVAGMSGYVPSVKDLKDKYKKLTEEENKTRNTGVGILFKSKIV